MTFPGEGISQVGETMLAKSLATIAPLVLTVAVTVAITISGDGQVVEGTAQVPGESLRKRKKEREREREREREGEGKSCLTIQ